MSFPVYVGRWQDYYQGSTSSGDVITLDVRSAGNLISALSLFVSFVGSAFWSLCCLVMHQYLAQRGSSDTLRIQHRVLFGSSAEPLGAIIDLIMILIAWWPRNGHVRANKLKLRSGGLLMPPLVILIGFTAASLLVSNVAGDSYASNNVLITPTNCGSFIYDTTPDGIRAEQQKILNDTIAGRAYADNCYGISQGVAQCNLFPSPAISYNTTRVSCPFGNNDSGISLCIGDQGQALQLDTGLRDTNDLLGINAAPENRILIRKSLTCSPINATSYITTDNSTTPIQLLNVGPVFAVSEYTYRYHTQTKSDGIGYQIFTLPAGPELWTPIEPLQVADGDVNLVVLTSNSIQYLAPVEDVWFSASTPVDSGAGNPTEYAADVDIAVMGCVDRVQICNPNTHACTVLSNLMDTIQAFEAVDLNDYQYVTAWRLIQVFGAVSTFYSINGLGDNALLARRNVFQVISSGLPSNQWQIEVRGWFDTSLAKLQAYVVSYVTNTVDLGPHGTIHSPDANGLPRERVAASFCHNQRVLNTGGYQTFVFSGIMVIVCVGAFIILLSILAPHFLTWGRRRSLFGKAHEYCEIARLADGRWQLLMTALRGSGDNENWVQTLTEHPITSADSKFPAPRQVSIDGVQYYVYTKVQDSEVASAPQVATVDIESKPQERAALVTEVTSEEAPSQPRDTQETGNSNLDRPDINVSSIQANSGNVDSAPGPADHTAGNTNNDE